MATARRVSPPVQERSARTLERIVEATEDLLRTKSFESVTVRDIVQRAKCPIASFYARFKSKDDLLPHLYERYNARVGPSINAKIAAIDVGDIDLRKAVELCVDLIVDSYSGDKWLMREVALFARRNPGAIDADTRKQRTGMHAHAASFFARFARDIEHKDAVRAAEVGIFLIAAVARESILFGQAPHASATALSAKALRATLIHTLYSFLTTPCESPHLCCLPSRR
jgi:AcrR family transcriptional regulator